MNIFQKKQVKGPLDELYPHEHLRRCLSLTDLTMLGMGAIIGAGIFILTGVVAATQAGPAIVLSFIVAGLACGFSALSYAELASSIGGCGSAYGYAYAGFGEVFAWIIGWDLILEYGIACAAVAIGWSAYFHNILNALGVHLPTALTEGPFSGGIVNLPAVGIILLIMFLLDVGIKASARFNGAIVIVKVLTIALFVVVAFKHVDFSHWTPFMPFGWQGVMNGAAMIFFAYIGFDAVSTAAEEAKNPRRDLPLAIILSLIICTAIYIIVSAFLTLIAPYYTLNVASPVSHVLLNFGEHIASSLIAVGALAGLTTVILVMYYGLSRIFLAMSRDKLLPQFFSHLNERTKTPARIINTCGILMAIVAGLFPIGAVAEMVNIGTLMAFALVNLGALVMRHRHPDLPRSFKVPGGPVLPILGMLFCVYLMFNLGVHTWLRFIVWMAIGFALYFVHVRYENRREAKGK